MKHELHEHISRLLYDHECVIVPGFGAFLTRYHSAEINHATHMMRPPSRRVYFNASIRNNDGLLAKSISLLEQVSYKKAQDLIAETSTAWQKTLKEGRKVKLAGIGRLYMDNHQRLQFNPSLEINYQRASYGLSIFRSPAIKREAEIMKTINKAIEKHVVVEHPETQKRKVAGWASWAAVLGPVILASAIGYSYFSSGSASFDNVASFNPMNFSRSITYTTPEEAVEEADEAVLDEAPVTSTEEETAVTTEEEIMDIDLPAVEDEVVRYGEFHIVVGSFKEERNAVEYITNLKAKGYDAYLAEGNNSYNRVAVGNYGSESEARQALLDIKQNVHPQSWIYIH